MQDLGIRGNVTYHGIMNVAILHFHFRRGGVGSVMYSQATSLAMTDAAPSVAFIVGAAPEEPAPAPVFVVPGLDYDSFSGAGATDLEAGAKILASSLEEALAHAFPSGCDLIHVHNPLLRKNARLLGALNILQKRGYALLVQEHDFAEDFRPDAYDSRWPYPESCDYAAINSRDRDNLVAAGLDSRHVHFLPNPVAQCDSFSPRSDGRIEISKGRRIALYPVRAIRRKNLGEAILLSRFLPQGAELAVTLPPTSGGDWGSYESWKAFAAEGEWPVRFEAGKETPLPELFCQSFAVVTTSVKEGFGYAYLDPLMRGIPVFGREIPHIVRDFSGNGIKFEGLYPAIPVPVPEHDREASLKIAEGKLVRFREVFGPSFGKAGMARLEMRLEMLARRFEREVLDFGALAGRTQASVLALLGKDEGFAAEVLRLNPILGDLCGQAPSSEEAMRRREAIVKGYSEREYGERLVAVYGQAVQHNASGCIDKAMLVERYLEPSAFFLTAS